MKSLVADDDATIRILLQTFLSRYGECDVAHDGREAVDAIHLARQQHEKYDLICMDLKMPEMDGQDAIREIRKQEAAACIFSRTIKIIVMTALNDSQSLMEALQGRCDAYLLKPIDTARLLEELQSLELVR